jgi:hypothetical protein
VPAAPAGWELAEDEHVADHGVELGGLPDAAPELPPPPVVRTQDHRREQTPLGEAIVLSFDDLVRYEAIRSMTCQWSYASQLEGVPVTYIQGMRASYDPSDEPIFGEESFEASINKFKYQRCDGVNVNSPNYFDAGDYFIYMKPALDEHDLWIKMEIDSYSALQVWENDRRNYAPFWYVDMANLSDDLAGYYLMINVSFPSGVEMRVFRMSCEGTSYEDATRIANTFLHATWILENRRNQRRYRPPLTMNRNHSFVLDRHAMGTQRAPVHHALHVSFTHDLLLRCQQPLP